MKTIPTLAADLIDQLNKEYPELTIKPGMSIEELMFRAGQRQLILNLKIRLEATNSGDIDNDN